MLASTNAINLLAELPILETEASGRNLSLGFSDGTVLQLSSTARVVDFLYAVSVQQQQATDFTRSLLNDDVNWLITVDQPLLNKAAHWSEMAAADTANGNDQQALLWNTAAHLALQIAGQDPASRHDLTARIQVGNHETDVTVYANPDLSTIGAGNRFHDIDPGILGVLEQIGVVAINIASIAFPVLTPAAAVVDAAEAGKAFANGSIFNGFLNLAMSVAAGLGGYSSILQAEADSAGAVAATAEQAGSIFKAAVQTATTLQTGLAPEAQAIGQAASIIYTSSEAIGGVYGAVQAAENGDAGGILGSALMAAAAIASGTGMASSAPSSQAFYAMHPG